MSIATLKHVVYSTDDNYWMHLYVSLYSLLKNNKDNKFVVYILTDEADQLFLSNTVFLYQMGNLVDCKIIEVEPSWTESFPLTCHYSRTAYYRLFVGQLLPDEIKKVLYLDCDTIINKSLEDLFAIDLKEYVIGAAPDHHENIPVASSRLNLPTDSKFFNSGVMLVDLDKWRANNVENRLIDYLKNFPYKLECVDQDVLNGVLYNECKELSQEYNFMLIDGELIPQKLKEGVFPSIIHYIIYYNYNMKPWYYMSQNPLKDIYWAYLRETPYCGYREEDRNLKNMLIKHKMMLRSTSVDFAKKYPFLYNNLRSLKRVLKSNN